MANVIDLTNIKRVAEKRIRDQYNILPNKEQNWAKRFKNDDGTDVLDPDGNPIIIPMNMEQMRDLIATVIYDVLSGLTTASGDLSANVAVKMSTGERVSGSGPIATNPISGTLNIAAAATDVTIGSSSVVISSGLEGAARNGDSVTVIQALNTAFWTLFDFIRTHTHSGVTTGIGNTGSPNSAPGSVPSSLSGTITSGSSKVKIG